MLAVGRIWFEMREITHAQSLPALAPLSSPPSCHADVVFSPQRYPAVTSWLQGMVQREGVRRGLQVLDPNPLLAAGEERDKVVNKAHERLAAMGLTQDALTAEP